LGTCVNTRQSIEGALVVVLKTCRGTYFQRSFLQVNAIERRVIIAVS
jgi:hypothetical protein